MRDIKAIDDVMPLAETLIEAFSSGDGQLSLTKFEFCITELAKSMKMTFHELAVLMIIKIAFVETGRNLLEDAVDIIIKSSSVNQEPEFDEAITQARLVMIFEVLDRAETGRVPFREIVKHLFRFSKQEMDATKREILLAIDKDSTRSMHFDEFAEFMLNVVTAFPRHISYHEIFNAMTLSAYRQDVTNEDMQELFTNHEIYEDALGDDKKSAEVADHNSLAYVKACKLFDIWDLDHDQTLTVDELAVGMRKFQKAKQMEETIEESETAMLAMDKNGDGVLDKEEFALLVNKFSRASGADILTFVDFLCVQTVLRDNTPEEEAYIKSIQKIKSPNKRPQFEATGSVGGSLTALFSKESSLSALLAKTQESV